MIYKFDNSNTYLLGCIHALKPGRHSYSKQIDNIYSQCTQIAFEANFDKISESLATYNDGSQLSENISNELFLKTRQLWIKCGFSTIDLNRTKPWRVAEEIELKLISKQRFSLKHGIDNRLFVRAKKDGKKITFLDSEGIGFFCSDNAPVDEQERLLAEVVDNPVVCIDNFLRLFNAWSAADTISLIEILHDFQKLCPRMVQCLLIDRNKAWLRAIVTSIETNTPSLFAVGALHLVDMCSIQAMIMENHGYTSTQIK